MRKPPFFEPDAEQLYASHYFQLALDLTEYVTDSGRAMQQGLTGLKGSLLRRIVLGKTRSAQEKNLINIRKALEERH